MLGGVGGVAAIVALQAAYGLGLGLVIPAEVGLVPQTVSDGRLQQANALQSLTRNLVGVLGPAIGGVIVVAASPGVALAADAVTFFVCAILLSRIRIAARSAADAPGFVSELREGWREFTSRTWLWGSAFGAGAVLGSLVAMRVRPRRPLVACVLAAVPLSLQTLSLALGMPAWVIGAAAFVAGLGLSIHLTLWFTVFQREIPERVQSRVASYDTLGSFVLIPIGVAIVGPVADAIGVTTTLWIAVAVMWASWAAILALPSVWVIGQAPSSPAASAA